MLSGVRVSLTACVHAVRPRRGKLDRSRRVGSRGGRNRPGADGTGVGLGYTTRRAARLKPAANRPHYYSQRSATAGSMQAARRTGNQLATSAAITKNKEIAA